MQWDEEGNKHFSSSMEAVMYLRGATRGIVRWLHECREAGGKPEAWIHFPQYRSVLNDIGNVTTRWIMELERKISGLEDAVRRAQFRCPRCGGEPGKE